MQYVYRYPSNKNQQDALFNYESNRQDATT
jgi:hypothetical protein